MTSLFDEEESNNEGSRLKVVQAGFIQSQETSWQDLFEGFDELHAITYSSGLNFTCNLLSRFKYAEIIFGCESVVDSDIATLLAHQITAIQMSIRNKALQNIATRINSDEINLYVSRDIKSHEKIFILKANDGRSRVICGSANMSASAFGGVQRENILYFDDTEAYDYYLKLFISFRNNCSDNMTDTVSARLLQKNESSISIDEIPICKTVASRSVVMIDKDLPQPTDVPQYISSITELSKELRPIIPKQQKSGSFILTTDTVRTVHIKYDEIKTEKTAKQKVRPKLHIDFESHQLTYNEKNISLDSDSEAVRNDIHCILKFIDGLSDFIGTAEEIKQTKIDYYKFLNWFFASVFCPKLRYTANQNDYDIYKLPVFGILYGASNGGKSTFVELLSKLMAGQKIPRCPSSTFTKTNIVNLKILGEGIPINIDDLSKEQFSDNYEGIIKNDTFGLTPLNVNYPAVTITANRIPSLKPDIFKRVVAFRIDTKIDSIVASNKHKSIRECIKYASNSLFKEYVRRMLPLVEELENQMKSSTEQFTPDIFKISSEVLMDIVLETSHIDKPEYITVYTWEDYLGSKVTSKTASHLIRMAWEHSKSDFVINRRRNELVYTIPATGSVHELNYIVDELPAALNARRIQHTLVMDLDAAQKHFEMSFRKGLL